MGFVLIIGGKGVAAKFELTLAIQLTNQASKQPQTSKQASKLANILTNDTRCGWLCENSAESPPKP